jgi:integrase
MREGWTQPTGVPVTLVSKILGHTNLTTTSRYLNIHLRGFTQRWKSWKLTAPPLHREL